MVDEGAQQDELSDRNPRNRHDCEAARRWIKHPIRDLIATAMWLPDQEVVSAVMLVIADHQHGLTDQRVEPIGNDGFECQKPGIISPALMRAVKIGRASLH